MFLAGSSTGKKTDIKNIPQFAGSIYYVNKNSGSDSNDGLSPNKPFETIGAGITTMISGDRLEIKAGVYTETGLDLDCDSCEMWFEIGAIIRPATGTALTVSGNYCRVICPNGALLIDPAGANTTGMLITGNFCYAAEIRIKCDSVADIGFDIQGDGCDLRRCRCSNPLVAAFKVSGDTAKLDNCCTGGEVANTSIGYWITGSCDKFRMLYCGSQGHSIAPFQVDTGCTNGVICEFSSGGGDGKWADVDSSTVISNLTYPETKYKEITLDGSGEYDLFTVIGSIEIIGIHGHVTTALTGVNTDVSFNLHSTNGDDEITNTTGADMGAAPVGTVVIKTEDPGKKVTVLLSGSPSVDKTADPKKRGVFLNADNTATTTIQWLVGAGDTSGVIHFHVEWVPLTDNGFVEPV